MLYRRRAMDAAPSIPLSVLARRALEIAWVLWLAPLSYAAWLFTRAPARDAEEDARDREHAIGRALAGALERLGATFVKLGQILGSRPDLLPPGVLDAMARLQDDVAPDPLGVVEGVLAREWGEPLRATVSLDPEPLAAASVAQVYAGTLAGGRRVAVKVQRPSARSQIERDLVLLGAAARVLDLHPDLALLSLPGAAENFGDSLRAQLDFRKEAENNRRFAHNFRREKKVRVPGLVPELCTERVLVMELVLGVKGTEPEKVGHDRAGLAERGGRAILKMVFEDGFVHADLHPGNIMLEEDGTMTFLDLGLVAEIPKDLLRPWVDTFSALAKRDGRWAARLFYEHAPNVGTRDYAEYERDVEAFLSRHWDRRLGDVEVSEVVGGMMNVLRRHRVQVDPVFTTVQVAVLVAEGLGKQLDPSIDLVTLAVPYLVGAQMAAPPGRAPRRRIPAH